MTRTFGGDATNDLFLDDGGNLALFDGLRAVLQNCESAARTVLDEMVLAQGEGIPYFTAVFVGTPNVAVFEAAIRSRLLAVPEVQAIVTLTTRREGDRLLYAATIRTPYGEGAISG